MKTLDQNLSEARAALDRDDLEHAILMACQTHNARYFLPMIAMVKELMAREPELSILDCVLWWKERYPNLFIEDVK